VIQKVYHNTGMSREEEQIQKRVERRAKKQTPRMKMSGKGMKRFGGGTKKATPPKD